MSHDTTEEVKIAPISYQGDVDTHDDSDAKWATLAGLSRINQASHLKGAP